MPVLLNTVNSQKNSSNKNPFKCSNCGTTHPRFKCPNKREICQFCSFKGHIIQFCRKKKQTEDSETVEPTRGNRTTSKQPNSKDYSKFSKSNMQSKKPNVSNIFVHEISSNSHRKFIDIQFNNQPVRLQVDSGADISIISQETCNKLNISFNHSTLKPSDVSGNSINLIGEFDCLISFFDQHHQSKLFVTQNKNLNIFGNDLLTKFNLWDKPFSGFCVSKQVFKIINGDYANYLKSNFASCFAKILKHT